MTQEKIWNPKKRLAFHLAHLMDDQKKENQTEWEREGMREAFNELNREILKSGFDINELLYLAEIYKTLSVKEYLEWKYI